MRIAKLIVPEEQKCGKYKFMKPESASKSDFRSLRPILADFASTKPKTSYGTVFLVLGARIWFSKCLGDLPKRKLLFGPEMPLFRVSWN